ncbi:class I adenylate-forming enzyme family protein [Amycolatopsis jiangsuensis]|uniref:Acyl-CoA synthetase (AMP-forming)/AMP-acid ligase II n=1 Tax=Amycolatopsis jiangsuensis TaxID=1181879 RepID=A0A840J1B5_9PSEU|nr:long-chain fatty acid--CoA ligase [Amycolatopsis jiangsuensis]MBB4688786.1 acyl-CoA synthetase (AMP-forming)/AMP-acid ligase II [Amycolatopsis jiangsuensis]
MTVTDDVRAHHYGDPAAVVPASPWRTPLDGLDWFSACQGDAPFVTAVAHDGTETTVNYRTAAAASRALAGWLCAEFGTTRPAVLAFAPTNDVPSVLTVLAVLRAGFGLLMLGPADPPERHALQLEAAGALATLHLPGTDAPHPDSRALPHWREPAEPAASPPPLDPAADALYFATSGSTAASKLVAQTHVNAVANAEAVRRHHGLVRGDRVLACLPIHHVNGLHFTVLGTMLAGAHTVLCESFSPLGYPATLQTFRPRIASVVPGILEALVETWRRPRLPAEFAYFVSAAAPLTSRTARAVADRLGARVLQGYGLSETTNFSCTLPPSLSDATYRELMLEADIPSVGTAVYGNEVAVLDPAGAPLPAGEVGEICMRGHNVMSRYVHNANATREAFRGGWFHSQDLGYRIERDGRGLFVLTGRLKNIAKVAGESVSLDEMDRALRALPQVRDAACVTVPDRFAGEKIVAAVVLSGEGQTGTAGLTGSLRATFPEGVLPSQVIALPAIPRTTTGKVLRPQLRDDLSALGRG